MGKRELLLAAAFIVVGVVVYQVTAPAADPARPGFSLSKMMNEIRREVRGQRESAEATTTRNIPVPASVNELRLGLRVGAITITGEDRNDIQSDFHVRSTGYDQAEAEQLVKESQLIVDEAGSLIIISAKFPVAGRQTPSLTLKVPRRLAVRIDEKNGPLVISGVGSVTASGSGDTTISDVAGQVALTQRGRVARIENAGGVRLNTTGGAEITLDNVRGDTTLNLQSSELTASRLAGGLEVEARNSELRFEDIGGLKGPVRLNLTAGEVLLRGLATEARIDGRRTEVRVEMAAAARLGIYNDSETIEVMLPKEGLRIDAAATDAQVSLDPALQKSGLTSKAPANGTPGTATLEGSLAGGGPEVTLRNTRGDIVLRLGESSTVEAPRPKEG